MNERFEISDYLLGELSGEELAEAERLINADPQLRATVERLRPTVQRLGELPPEAWQELQPPPLELPPASEHPAEAPAARRSWWRGNLELRPALAVAASVALLAAGLGAGLLLGDRDDLSGPSRTVALEPVSADAGQAAGSARLAGVAGGEADVRVSGLSATAPGEFYELWLLTAPDDLISLGSFSVGESGRAEVRVPLPVDPSEFDYIDLSLERDDGDVSHSGRSVLRAPT